MVKATILSSFERKKLEKKEIDFNLINLKINLTYLFNLFLHENKFINNYIL